MSKITLRCAIYTRKSTAEGLAQEFNSLDAQRAACGAFITSQVGQGWKELPKFYDDGGISGGTMERPALLDLLADIKAGKVDVVVVYKIDRHKVLLLHSCYQKSLHFFRVSPLGQTAPSPGLPSNNLVVFKTSLERREFSLQPKTRKLPISRPLQHHPKRAKAPELRV